MNINNKDEIIDIDHLYRIMKQILLHIEAKVLIKQIEDEVNIPKVNALEQTWLLGFTVEENRQLNQILDSHNEEISDEMSAETVNIEELFKFV